MRLSDMGNGILSVSQPEYEPNPSGLIGATNYYRYHIEALKAGDSGLLFETNFRGSVSDFGIAYHVFQ